MKNSIRLILVTVALSVVFACQEKESQSGNADVNPVFPELVTNYEVAPGQDLEFTFTPNLDWELSVSEESTQFFKLLEENGRQREKLSGKASDSPITVKIWVNPLEEYENNRSCVLTLTMGGVSQKVAEYMRPAKSRILTVYSAKLQDGVFVTDDSGAYVYEETEAQNVEIIWSEEDAAFMLPIKVVANCSWDIDRETFPSWLELNVPDKTEGVVELVILGNSLEDASATVGFKASDEILSEMNVTIKSCTQLGVYSAQYEQGDWLYVDAGYEYTAEPQTNLVMVWTGTDIRIPVMVDSKCEWSLDKPEWITAELDDKRAGKDHFVLMCNPQNYPLDDTDVTISFKYSGQVIQSLTVTVPGCRELISYVLGISLSSLEFNYAGQYKTTSGFMDAPLSGNVTAPASMTMRLVEIIDGKYVEEAPEWLLCELSVDSNTDTKMVLQTKTLNISVTENLGAAERSAYICLLPREISDLSELFKEDQCTIADEYAAYVIPVTQACVPADFLTPENSAEAMALEGASIIKSEKAELYECFGQTSYAYEITYKNTWSGDVAQMYLTYPYSTIEFYDAEKNRIADEDKDNFWITYTDYTENKTFGAIIIPTVRQDGDDWIELNPVAGTAYVVFKDKAEEGKPGETLCVVEFTYAPEIVGPSVPVEEDDIEDAGNLFVDQNAAASAGATLVQILAVNVPTVTGESSEQEINYAKYKKNLSETLEDCKSNKISLYRLTYKKSDTELKLNFTSLLKGKAKFYSVNPWNLHNLVTIDAGIYEEVGGAYFIETSYHGTPQVKMNHTDETAAEELSVTPLVIRFLDQSFKPLVAIECVLAE